MNSSDLNTRIVQEQIRSVYSRYLEAKNEYMEVKKELKSVEGANDVLQEKIDKLLDHAHTLKQKKETLVEENFKLGLSICQSKIERGKTRRAQERVHTRLVRRRSSVNGSVQQLLSVLRTPFKKKKRKKRMRQKSVDEGCQKHTQQCMILSKEVKLVRREYNRLRMEVLEIFSKASAKMEDDLVRLIYVRSNLSQGNLERDISNEVAYYQEFKRLRDLKEENELKFAKRTKDILEGIGILDFPYSKIEKL